MHVQYHKNTYHKNIIFFFLKKKELSQLTLKRSTGFFQE